MWFSTGCGILYCNTPKKFVMLTRLSLPFIFVFFVENSRYCHKWKMMIFKTAQAIPCSESTYMNLPFLYGHNVGKCIPPTACGLSKIRITGLIALVATTLFFLTWITCFGHDSFFSSINWLRFFQLIELCFCAITFNICHFFLIVDHSVVVFTFSNSNDFGLFYILWLICTNPCLWFSDLVKICYLSLMHHPSEQKLQLLNLMWLWLLQDHTWS